MLPPVPEVPPSHDHTVKVSIINGALSHLPAGFLVEPTIKGHKNMQLVNYSFFIESLDRDKRVVCDLALMKDLGDRMPPALERIFEGGSGGVDATYDTPDNLVQYAFLLSTINENIWLHSYIGHVGDPSVFPVSIDLVVGPGFKVSLMPGYPANPE